MSPCGETEAFEEALSPGLWLATSIWVTVVGSAQSVPQVEGGGLRADPSSG